MCRGFEEKDCRGIVHVETINHVVLFARQVITCFTVFGLQSDMITLFVIQKDGTKFVLCMCKKHEHLYLYYENSPRKPV